MRKSLWLAALMTLLLPFAAAAQERQIESQTGRLRVQEVATGLAHPWSLAFLPDGRMLVTERPGRLRMITADGSISPPLQGVPRVFAQGQGGLLGIALDPDFATNRRIYLAFAEPGEGGASTAVARGRLGEGAIEDAQVIFQQLPKVSGPNHFGGRLAFARDGTLFVTTGERFKFDPAQDLTNHLGKVIRINPDGSVPRDNPFVGRQDARPEIWSYGHRNIQGAAIHPETGVLWIHEFGPRGGDELNIPEPGKNYGWPLVSWGRHYGGTPIPDPPTRPDLAGSVRYWNPAISPTGMAFYTGDAVPGWKGNLLIGCLTWNGIVRLTLKGTEVTGEERINLGTRIRDVSQGPDGAVYVLTDESDGEVLRITGVPASGQR